ncbi:hypothetical protein D3C80_1665810 [compost metagenome]
MTQHNLCDCFHLRTGAGGAGGVVGKIENEPLGTWRNRSFQIFGTQFETGLFDARHSDGNTPCEFDDIRIADP